MKAHPKVEVGQVWKRLFDGRVFEVDEVNATMFRAKFTDGSDSKECMALDMSGYPLFDTGWEYQLVKDDR